MVKCDAQTASGILFGMIWCFDEYERTLGQAIREAADEENEEVGLFSFGRSRYFDPYDGT